MANAELCNPPVHEVLRHRAAPSGNFASLAANRLQWLPDLGLGFLDVEYPGLYDADYFRHFQDLDRTPFAAKLNEARVQMVRRHWTGPVCDVGIGGGSFIEAHGNASGADVNPLAIEWLAERGLLWDALNDNVDAVTMWDSIEHMRNPAELLDRVRKWAFVSTPIYVDAEHALASKHFKPGEHLWYFTQPGLCAFMRAHGFLQVEINYHESVLGREDIGSFAFKRGTP